MSRAGRFGFCLGFTSSSLFLMSLMVGNFRGQITTELGLPTLLAFEEPLHLLTVSDTAYQLDHWKATTPKKTLCEHLACRVMFFLLHGFGLGLERDSAQFYRPFRPWRMVGRLARVLHAENAMSALDCRCPRPFLGQSWVEYRVTTYNRCRRKQCFFMGSWSTIRI